VHHHTPIEISIIVLKVSAAFVAIWIIGRLLKAVFSRWIEWIRARLRSMRKADYHGIAKSRFIQVEGLRVHYVQEGSGPDLLLVHGIASSIFCWRFIFKALSTHYRVTALDLPGFGLSDKPASADYSLDAQAQRIFSFLTELKIKKTFIVAHSMGGAISAWLTQLHPEIVNKILFISPALSHKIMFPNPLHFSSVWSWALKLDKNIIITKSMVRFIYNRMALYKKPLDFDSAVEQYLLPYQNSPEALAVFFKHMGLLRDSRLTTGLNSLKRPALILYGTHDRVVAKKHYKSFLTTNTEVKIISTSHCGHQMMEEKPEFLLENIRTFFDS
jgi:pimeloyl-ACP methyl ester carboxylesterase